MDLVPSDGCVDWLHRPGGQGSLSGIRLAVKDNIEVAGAIWSAGHPLFAARRGITTALAVQELLDAGAGLVAMAVTDAGGFGVTTPGVRNPRHPGRVVGGSSGGCAALVASGQADLGLGTDTGGSCRIPAACTGLWGLKPRHGQIPSSGLWPMAPRFDDVGLMAADPHLLRTALNVLLPDVPVMKPPKRRIGYCIGTGWHRDPVTNRLFAQAVDAVSSLGIEAVEVSLPNRAVIGRCHAILVLEQALAVHREIPNFELDQLAPAARRALRAAERVSAEDTTCAKRVLAELIHNLDLLQEQFDAILSPTLPVVPPRIGQIDARLDAMSVLTALTAETCLANLTGRPAIAGPAGLLSLQLTGLAMSAQDLAAFAPGLFENVPTRAKYIP